MAELSTKSGIFETGVKDEHGVAYKDGRVVGSYDKHLTEYAVKDGTEVICDRAFYDKKELRELHLPSSVKAIGESAFAGCKALESVNIPEGVTEIKTATFRDCKSLRRLELPASCTKIAKWAFTDGIETLVCNAEALQIDKSAFLSCKTLKTVMIPEGCVNAYIQAFLPCGIMPQFEEMKEEHIEEEPMNEEEFEEEEILEKDTFEDEEDIFDEDTSKDDSFEDEDDDNDNDLITNQKEKTMEEKKMEDPILGTSEFDAEGRPVVSLTFKMYYLNGTEDSCDEFMESKSEGLGIFVAVGSKRPSAEPFKDYLFMAPVDAFYEGYYAYKEEDPDGAADLLNRGLVMYACTEPEYYNGSCVEALELIFGEDNPENYNGPEAIFKIKVVDGDANDEDMKDYCIRVYQNEDGKWTSEELEN